MKQERRGVGLATSLETLGVDLRTRTKQLGAKAKARRKKCDVRFARRNRAFQKQPFEDEEVAEDGLGSCESVCGLVKPLAPRLEKG